MTYKISRTAQKQLTELKNSKCSAETFEVIKNLIADGNDFDCYKINVFRVAEQSGISRAEAIQGFLYAARLGIMDLNWDIHCPSCKGIPVFHKHLMGLQQKAHCALCEIDWQLDFSDQVEVTFTVNPNIRQIDYKCWSELDFQGKMQFLDAILEREKRRFTVGCCIYGGKTTKAAGDFLPGEYIFHLPSYLENSGTITVLDELSPSVQKVSLTFNKKSEPSQKSLILKQGRVEFSVKAEFEGMNGFLILPRKPIHNFVSASYITGLQDFKDLFAGEFLREDVSFAVKSITLMFTDIKGSTAMYERLGDSAAYSLVQKHFDVMTEIIKEYNGGIVKTIGDAVMASFSVNAEAVAAALKIQKEFWRLNQENKLQDIEVKIGLHRGPAITVTSNRSLDFFGRTVNIAARVQSKSSEHEILISGAVYEDEAIRPLLKRQKCKIKQRDEELKGIASRFRVYSVQQAKNA
jgi:class 3 adenylate cyclase